MWATQATWRERGPCAVRAATSSALGIRESSAPRSLCLPRRARAPVAMARVVATRARGAELPLALACGDDDALMPGGQASAAGRHAAPVDMSFFEDDDASLLAELLDERTPRAAAGAASPAAAMPNCLNPAHRRGCTEYVAALRRGGLSAVAPPRQPTRAPGRPLARRHRFAG